MRSRSAVRGRLGSSPAPSGERRLGGVLALQRMAGNRAVRALIARDAKVIKIGNESVRVASDAEKAEAERIIKDVKAKFGVSFDSLAAHKATLAENPEGSVPEDRRKALAVRPSASSTPRPTTTRRSSATGRAASSSATSRPSRSSSPAPTRRSATTRSSASRRTRSRTGSSTR
jgi:hypothetical protein